MLIRALLALPDVGQVDAFAEPWSRLYSHSSFISTIVLFGHIAGLLAAGGLALASDRVTLRIALDDDVERRRHLADLARIHRIVAAGLGVAIISGTLLFFADVEVFATSRIFWVKMALMALLIVNLTLMTRVERALRGDGGVGVLDSATSARDRLWRRRRVNAGASVVLWFVLVLAGAALATH